MRWNFRLNPLEWLFLLSVLATLGALMLPDDLAALFDDNPNNTLPITEILPPNIPADDQASVQLVELSRNADLPEHQRITFAIVNHGPTAVYYYGYTPTSYEPRLNPGELRPFYRKQIQLESDWKDERLKRCGNGGAVMCLPPGHAGKFYAYQRHDEAASRIGVSYSPDEDAEEDTRLVAWSKTIEFD